MKLDLPLVHLYRSADVGADHPGSGDAAQPWLLVLLHGVGSNERDLHGLAPAVPARFHVLSLRAPFPLGPDAYGWFTFGVRPDGHRVIDAEQEAVSRPLILRTVGAAAAQLGIPGNRVVLGGFSQGGIMSLSLLLTEPAALAAAMVMHGRLLPEILPVVAPGGSLRGRRLWVSHGTQDQVIDVAAARDIRDQVRGLPIELNYAEFPGGHEIRPAELTAAMAWLQGLSGTG